MFSNKTDNESNPVAGEARLVGTLISEKPDSFSFYVAFGFVLVVGIVTLIYWQNPSWSEKFEANRQLVFEKGEWWRIVLAIFVHHDLAHYLSNMLMLSVLGYFVFAYFGFGVFPLASVVLASMANAMAIFTYPDQVRLIGASGLVFVLGGFWLVLYLLIQRQYPYWQRVLRTLGIGLVLFFPSTFKAEVSYRTHIFGGILGALFGFFYFYLNKKNIRSHEKYSYELPEELGEF